MISSTPEHERLADRFADKYATVRILRNGYVYTLERHERDMIAAALRGVADSKEPDDAALKDGALAIEDDAWVIANWKEYQDPDPTASARKRKQRDKDEQVNNLKVLP